MSPSTIHPIWLVVVAAAFAALPLVMGLFTAYVKISVVLGLLRSALGTQQVPSGLVIMALSVSLTIYTMAPVLDQSVRAIEQKKLDALIAAPSLAGFAALAPAIAPLRAFLVKHSGARELRVLSDLAAHPNLAGDGEAADEGARAAPFATAIGSTMEESADETSPDAISLNVLLPAFVLTELKEAFAMGFVLLLPFLVIDLIVANVLVGMGMMMVSPVMVSLPLKLVLFVVADGWLLLAKGLLQSYY